jgi:ABC-2 type transport system permease protein
MMKVIDIAVKDLKQSFRSFFALAFMFGVPLLMTLIFVFLFGGTGGDEGESTFDLPTIYVQIANLDQGEKGIGAMLVDVLQTDETLRSFIEVAMAESAASARKAVDSQQAGVAVIIPADFSEALFQSEMQTEVEVYADPTLTVGPGIITAIVTNFSDTFSGAKIVAEVAVKQSDKIELSMTPEQINALVGEYIQIVGTVGGETGYLHVQTPEGVDQPVSTVTGVIGMVMAGTMILYAFFTAANSMQSILKEEENGTLPRLFTTPTDKRTFLYGKFLSTAVTVLVQVVVLLAFGRMVFGFEWGSVGLLILIVLGITISATTFGIFLISLVTNSRQVSIAIGGGVTATGMLGMMGIFTMGAPSKVVDAVSLLVPQGWALQSLQINMEGGSLEIIVGRLIGLLAWSVMLFLIGNHRFSRRYA